MPILASSLIVTVAVSFPFSFPPATQVVANENERREAIRETAVLARRGTTWPSFTWGRATRRRQKTPCETPSELVFASTRAQGDDIRAMK
jgi:hypothetical protein